MKWMHAIIKAPQGLASARAVLDLVADVDVLGLRVPGFLSAKKPEGAHLVVTWW